VRESFAEHATPGLYHASSKDRSRTAEG
jgi:hypothetical protein